MADNPVASATLSFYWSDRKKCWDLVIRGGSGREAWTWSLECRTTAAMDQGTGWLIAAAARDGLEAQLY